MPQFICRLRYFFFKAEGEKTWTLIKTELKTLQLAYKTLEL